MKKWIFGGIGVLVLAVSILFLLLSDNEMPESRLQTFKFDASPQPPALPEE